MRIGQAIDQITIDRSKEFCNEELVMFWDYNTCQIAIRNNETNDKLFRTVLTNDHFGREWLLIQKPVTFMEAVESGKPFRPESWRDNTEMELDDFMYDISSHSNEGIREYLLGKFYIKEDK